MYGVSTNVFVKDNIKLNLIGDKYPKEVSNHGQ